MHDSRARFHGIHAENEKADLLSRETKRFTAQLVVSKMEEGQR